MPELRFTKTDLRAGEAFIVFLTALLTVLGSQFQREELKLAALGLIAAASMAYFWVKTTKDKAAAQAASNVVFEKNEVSKNA